MINLFPSRANHKPVAKAIHQFNPSTTTKWVPVNKSFITLAKIILRSAVERLGLVNVAITLRCITHQDYRHLVLVNNDQTLQFAAMGRVEEFIISTEVPISPAAGLANSTETLTLPVDFQQQRLGYLVAFLGNPAAARPTANLQQELGAVAEEIVSVIKRYQTRYRAIYIYGDQAFWIGNSTALRQLDQRIDALAHSPLPVLIRGNKGTGKIIAARTLHCQRHADMVPFIESACNEWEEGAAPGVLQALYAYARCGTLFLRNIDKLSSANFAALHTFWSARFQGVKGAQHEARLIFSLSEHHAAVAAPMAQWLHLHSAELCLPELSSRREDIRDLARFFIREYSLSMEFDFVEDAWRMLEAYAWVQNVSRLKQVIQQVALRVDCPLVTKEVLMDVLGD